MSFNPDRSRINNEIVRARNEELQRGAERAAERQDRQRAVERVPNVIARGLARARVALRRRG
jgi:hypothetical protein